MIYDLRNITQEFDAFCLEPILLLCVHNNEKDSVQLNNLSLHNGGKALHP